MRRIICDSCNKLISSPSKSYGVMGYGRVIKLYCKECYIDAHKKYGGESFGNSPSEARKKGKKHLLAEGEWSRMEVILADFLSLLGLEN